MTTTTPQRDTRPVTAPLWAWERFLTHAANDNHWNHADDPELGEAWNVLMAAKAEALGHEPPVTEPARPPLPPVLEIRSRDGQVVAEIGPGPDGRFVVHLPVAYEDDEEPADAFAGRVDPGADF